MPSEHVILYARPFTLDHADVIGSVSYGQGHGPFISLDQLHHLSLLQRGNPAADDGLAHTGRAQKLQLHAGLKGISLRVISNVNILRAKGYCSISTT